MEVPEVSLLDVTMGNIKHLPRWDSIPEEFQDNRHPLCKVMQSLFFEGGRMSDHGYFPKEGVDAGKATAALGAILSSFEPKHEHKIAGAAYLASQWFEKRAKP